MLTFSLPLEADPEPGLPHLIRHGCDYMRGSDEKLEFYYNYLDYTWIVGGREISARSYFDECDKISFAVSKETLGALDAADILAFVQRRFSTIQTFEIAGYLPQWTRVDACHA